MTKKYKFSQKKWWILNDRKGVIEVNQFLTINEDSKNDIEFFENEEDWIKELKNKNIYDNNRS